MKKLVLLLLTLVSVLTARAEQYTYLTFVTTDGAKASVPVEALALTISGTTLKAGSQTFTLSNLSKMYFSTTDETNADAIEKLTMDDSSLENAEIYDLKGRKITTGNTTADKLPRGVYIVKTNDKTCKVVVR